MYQVPKTASSSWQRLVRSLQIAGKVPSLTCDQSQHKKSYYLAYLSSRLTLVVWRAQDDENDLLRQGEDDSDHVAECYDRKHD